MAIRGFAVPGPHATTALRRATTLAFDVNGRIWAGEHNGLTRIDGDILHRYPGAQTPGMTEGFVHALYPLSNGDMLVGLNREGILLWSSQRDAFERVLQGSGQPLTRINALRKAQSGGVWVAADKGLYHWQGPGARLTEHAVSDASGVSRALRVLDVLELEDGQLWLASDHGVYRRESVAASFERVATGSPALDLRLATDAASVLAADPEENIWIGLMNEGVVVVPRRGVAWAPDGLRGVNGSVHGGRSIRSMLWDQEGMWVGTHGGGLVRVEGRKARRQPVNVDAYQGGRSLLISEMAQGPDGSIWIAGSSGLFHFDPLPGAVTEIDSSLPGSVHVQSLSTVRSLHMDSRQRLWMGMEEGGLQVLDRINGTRHRVSLPAAFEGGAITALMDDRHGRIWVVGNSVAWVDAGTLAAVPAGELGQLRGLRFSSLVLGADAVWLGHQNGLVAADREGRLLRRMSEGGSGLRSARIQSLAWFDDALWAGTSSGLYQIDVERWKAQPVPLPGAGETAAPFVGSLLPTADGLLVGHSHALLRLSKGDGKRDIWLDTGGRDVRALVADGSGGVWFTLADGSIVHRRADGRMRGVDPRDGLYRSPEMPRGNAVMEAGGHLLVATDSAVVRVDNAVLEQPRPAMPDLRPRLVSAWFNGQAVPADALPQAGQRWRLGASVERVVMAFSARDYIAPEMRRYSYRLEGLDSNWVDVQDRVPTLLFSRLPPGQYSLVMRTQSDEFPGEEWVSRIPLDVAPNWYQRGPVHAGGVVVLLLAAWGLMYMRNVRQQQDQLLLEKTIEQRTLELRKANERLDRLAGEDGLTGLFNRRRIFEHISSLQARRGRMEGTDVLVLLDLDHFKQINDRHGHMAGDAVLREVARRIRAELRTVDLASRIGGEELMLVLPDTRLEDGARVVERLAQSLRALPVTHGDLRIPVKASFGLTVIDCSRPIEESISRADEALYRAKEQGRDQICVEA